MLSQVAKLLLLLPLQAMGVSPVKHPPSTSYRMAWLWYVYVACLIEQKTDCCRPSFFFEDILWHTHSLFEAGKWSAAGPQRPMGWVLWESGLPQHLFPHVGSWSIYSRSLLWFTSARELAHEMASISLIYWFQGVSRLRNAAKTAAFWAHPCILLRCQPPTFQLQECDTNGLGFATSSFRS